MNIIPLSYLSKKLTPFRIVLLGYVFITLLGAFLLSLPFSSSHGQRQPFLDALFLATSGISTTGLAVVDIGSYYSFFGQLVLLCIFQIGGIGYMCFLVLIMHLLGIRGSLITRAAAKESLAGSSFVLFKEFFFAVLAYTLIFEGIGAIILSLFWMREYSIAYAWYLGIFHSISAFCTAGFSLFSDSLVRYEQSTIVNGTIIFISLAGGIGFFALKDITHFIQKKIQKKHPARLALHTKLVLIVTAAIILLSTLVIFFSDYSFLGANNYHRILTSFFQTVSASTTDGFNTIDIGTMSIVGLTVIMFLMFIGASPGSTGGGIKTTTLALLFVFTWSNIRKKKNNIFKRELSDKCVHDALVVFLCFASVLCIDIVILSATEKASYVQILFEIISALGNTGLSTGITASMTTYGKIILIITMFIGRVGPLSIAYAIFAKQKNIYFLYPQEDVFVG